MSVAENAMSIEVMCKQRSAQISIAIGAVLISFSAVFAKIAAVGPTASAFYRMGFGGLILALVCILKGEKIFTTPRVFLYNSCAAVFMCLDLAFWHRSIQHVGPGLATILGNCQVFALALIGVVFYQEKINYKFFMAIGAAIVGMFMLVGDQWGVQGSGYKIGVFQGLGTAIGYAGYVVFLKKVQALDDAPDMKSNMVQLCLTSSVLLLLYAEFAQETIMVHQFSELFYLFLYGLIGQCIGWMMISRGLPHTKISVAGFLILLQPTFSFIWDMTIFHRPTPMIEVIGALVTLLAIYTSIVSRT